MSDSFASSPKQGARSSPEMCDTAGPSALEKQGAVLEGRLRLLLLYDVSEQIDLARIQEIFGSRVRPVDALLGAQKSTPYIRFRHPPVAQNIQQRFCIGEQGAEVVARYYSFGVIVLQIEIPFRCDWQALARQFAALSEPSARVEEQAAMVLKELCAEAGPAIVRSTRDWLAERYMIVNVLKISGASGQSCSPEYVKSLFGGEIATLLRGETVALSREETQDVLAAGLSYYESDLTIVTSTAAFIYDRPDEAAVESHILEYARIQLLEFRYYDALLGGLLDELYDALEVKRNVLLARWTLPRDANRFNKVRVDTMELKERVDNAVKFVSDAFYAKMYRLAAQRMGVSEYRQLVDEKLDTVGQLHEFMVGQFNEARSFMLEVVAAVLALIDVLFLLRGK
jgi:hypothetical protein